MWKQAFHLKARNARKGKYLIPANVVNVCFRQLLLKYSDYSDKLMFFDRIDYPMLASNLRNDLEHTLRSSFLVV